MPSAIGATGQKQLFVTPITEVAATDVEGVGTIRVEQDKIYRWVKNAETATTFSAGQVVAHVITAGTTAIQEVKQMATANLSFLAGVVMGTLVGSSYGWIQIWGTGSVSVSGATTGGTDIAAGDVLKGVNAAAHMVRDQAAGAATPPVGFRNVKILVSVTTTTTPAAALKAGEIRCL